MKISVALCTYNGEKYLRQQLESIEHQTRKPDELVACDDCSKDATMLILEAFTERVSFPVQVIRNYANLGIVKNFENAVRLCSGDIIVLCDQDDVWKPIKLAAIENIFLENPNAGYVFSDADLVDENLNPLGGRLWDSIGFKGEFAANYSSGDQLLCFLKMQFVTGAAMAFRSKLKEFIFPFPENDKWIHDGWIAVLGSSIGWSGIPIVQPLIDYRQHQGQQMGAPEAMPPERLWSQFQELKKNRKEYIEEWLLFSCFFTSFLKRLQQINTAGGRSIEYSIQTVEEFLLFVRNRQKIFSAKAWSRVSLVFREFMAGRYGKFSYGWKSALADLILRQ